MNRRSKLALGVLGAVGLIAVAAVCSVIAYAYATNRSFETTLATNLTVSSERTELSPRTMLQTRRQVAEVAIALSNFRPEDIGRTWGEIKLADERRVHPHIQVVAANGS